MILGNFNLLSHIITHFYSVFVAIKALYFTRKSMFDNDTATVLYHVHVFTTVVFFMCIFGAIISDSWLGKFNTILYLSLVYAFVGLRLGVGVSSHASLPLVAINLNCLNNWLRWRHFSPFSTLYWRPFKTHPYHQLFDDFTALVTKIAIHWLSVCQELSWSFQSVRWSFITFSFYWGWRETCYSSFQTSL